MPSLCHILGIGVSVLFSLWVGEDDKNSSVNIIQVCAFSVPYSWYWCQCAVLSLGGEDDKNSSVNIIQVCAFSVPYSWYWCQCAVLSLGGGG